MDTQAFVERCGSGHLLAVVLSGAGDVVATSPGLFDALGGSPDSERLNRLMRGAENGLSPVSTLELNDGSRMVGFAEIVESRLERQLRKFATAHRLTPAERAALSDIAAGSSAKDSAMRLSLSPETVRARRKRIFRKVGVDGCGAILAKLLRD